MWLAPSTLCWCIAEHCEIFNYVFCFSLVFPLVLKMNHVVHIARNCDCDPSQLQCLMNYINFTYFYVWYSLIKFSILLSSGFRKQSILKDFCGLNHSCICKHLCMLMPVAQKQQSLLCCAGFFLEFLSAFCKIQPAFMHLHVI